MSFVEEDCSISFETHFVEFVVLPPQKNLRGYDKQTRIGNVHKEIHALRNVSFLRSCAIGLVCTRRFALCLHLFAAVK